MGPIAFSQARVSPASQGRARAGGPEDAHCNKGDACNATDGRYRGHLAYTERSPLASRMDKGMTMAANVRGRENVNSRRKMS